MSQREEGGCDCERYEGYDQEGVRYEREEEPCLCELSFFIEQSLT